MRRHFKISHQEPLPRKTLKRGGGREADSPTVIHTLISWLIHFCINSVYTKDALLFHIMEGAAKWLASTHTEATLTFVKMSKLKGINNSQLYWKIALKGFYRLIKKNVAVKVWHIQAAKICTSLLFPHFSRELFN